MDLSQARSKESREELLAHGTSAGLAIGAGLLRLALERNVDLADAGWLIPASASVAAALCFGLGAGLVCTLVGALLALVPPWSAAPSAGLSPGLLLFVACGVLASAALGRRRAGRPDAGPRAEDARLRPTRVQPDALLVAILALDERGNIESFNAAAERTFGYAAHEVIGRNVSLLVAPSYGDAHDRRVLAGGREMIGRRKDGTLFPLELSLGEVVLSGRRVFTGFVRDISERKRLEEEIVQAQKLEAVGSLANGIAHDFNNVLMGILACSRVGRRELESDATAVELLTEIGDAASRGIALTRQLLSFSSGRSPTLGPTSIDAVIRKNEAMLRRLLGEDFALRIELSPRGAHIVADEGLLEQVLLNLLVNARDAMPRGGEILVKTCESERPARAILQVRDSGTGIPAELHARIFEPFFTTKDPGKGTGLGLSTVQRVVTQLGGRIELESEVGRGTSFRLCFPGCASTPAPSAPLALETRRAPGPKTVLLVEDDRLVRIAVRRYLEGHGYRVLTADGPSEAVAAACANPRIDVLLTDMILPGSGGNELAQEIQARVPRIRVVFMSAHSAEFLADQQRLRPGDPYLQKPFELEDLLRVLADAFEPA